MVMWMVGEQLNVIFLAESSNPFSQFDVDRWNNWVLEGFIGFVDGQEGINFLSRFY